MNQIALYDLNGTLAEDSKEEGKRIYASAIKAILQPLEELPPEAFEKELGSKISARKLKQALQNLLTIPKRGTKAREVYYDLWELELEKGRGAPAIFPDVFAKNNCITQDKNEGLKIICFSRGTQAMLEKTIRANGLDKIVKRIYSVLPYGGVKNKQAYKQFYLDQLKEGNEIVKNYEDEWSNLRELFEAGCEIALELKLADYPYQIIWVDRIFESKKIEAKHALKKLETKYEKLRAENNWKTRFQKVFVIKNNLL